MAYQTTQTATIAAGGTKSAAVGIADYLTGGFQLPATFTGTAMTFEVSADGSTFVALNDSSGAISLTVAQGKAYALPAAVMAYPWVKFVSGSTEGAARSILVSGKTGN